VGRANLALAVISVEDKRCGYGLMIVADYSINDAVLRVTSSRSFAGDVLISALHGLAY
jgi:hypothetical protein